MNPVLDTDAMNKESTYRKKGTELLQKIETSPAGTQEFTKLTLEDQQAVTEARQRRTDRESIIQKAVADSQ